ncbi:hypothetical protein PspLS_10602 [Pyricularia sp. CBS 133598]|nr:hypothetical protein PspLS_10602 [Pyricularia sp. CBS 133598]
MTALARILSIGRHHAFVSIKHRPLAAKCITISPHNHTYSSQELDRNSDHVAQFHSSSSLPSETEHVGFSKTGEWSGLGDTKAPKDGKSQHSGKLDHVDASPENGEITAASDTPIWMVMCETAIVDRHREHNSPAHKAKAAPKHIKHGVIRDLEYFVPHLKGYHLSELATLDRAAIDKYIESILHGVHLFAQLDPVANSAYKEPKGWLQISSKTVQLNGLGQVFQTTIQAHIPEPNSRVVGVGHGASSLDAIRAAWLHILVKQSASWLPRVRLLDPNLTEADLCDDINHSEYDMCRSYTAAAARGSVPTVDFMLVTLYSPHDRKLILCYKFSIEAEDLGISVQTTARSITGAVAMAQVLFVDKIKALDKMHPAAPDKSLLSIVGPPENADQFVKTFLETQRGQRKGLYSPVDVTVEHRCPLAGAPMFCVTRLLSNGRPVGPTVMDCADVPQMRSLASYAAALHLAAVVPTIDTRHKIGNPSQQLIPLLELPLEPSALGTMTVPRSIRSKVVQHLPANAVEYVQRKNLARRHTQWMLPIVRASLNRRLAAWLEAYKTDPDLEHIRAQRASLPINNHREQVLKLIKRSHFCIVTGATGSGKTTQIPQIILDDAIEQGRGADTRILCLQTRRIAATWVARRVASERGEPLGESVGYHVRFDSRHATRGAGTVNFFTFGIFLRQLQDGVHNILDMYSHIVIDEVHERLIELDLILVALKKAFAERLAKGERIPKVILMSAFIGNQKQLQEYFADIFPDSNMRRLPAYRTCPVLSIPGRTFPVSSIFLNELFPMIRDKYGEQFDLLLKNKHYKDEAIKYLDTELYSEWDIADKTLAEQHAAFVPVELVAATIAYIVSSATPGAILVFLPGLKEILSVNDMLRDRQGFLGIDFNDNSKFRINFLHSTVSTAEQNEIFKEIPLGCRRIVLSSNIAETSVTVPDVVHVVDVGKTRVYTHYPSTRVTGMNTIWQTKSKAIQRQGRAGRTQEGHYYGLYSQQRHQRMEDTDLPDMLKLDLTTTCLAVKALGFQDNVADFLAAAITPPSPIAVQKAVNSLKAMDALAENETVTSLGRLLLRMPLHPSIGKMVLLGVFFRCLGPMIILCALPDGASLLHVPHGQRSAAREAHKKFRSEESDHLIQINIFNRLRQLEQVRYFSAVNFARRNFLNFTTYEAMKRVARQIEQALIKTGMFPSRDEIEQRFSGPGGIHLNVNSGNKQLLKALLVKGLYPNVAVKVPSHPKKMLFRAAASGSEPVSLRTDSVIHPTTDHEDKFKKYSLVVYSDIVSQVHMNWMYLSRVSHLDSPLVLALFGGPLLRPGLHDTVVQQQMLPTPDGSKFGFAYKVEDPGHDSPRSRTPAETLVQFREHMDAVLDDAFRRLFQQHGKVYWNFNPGADKPWAGTAELEDLVDRVMSLLDPRVTRSLSTLAFWLLERGSPLGLLDQLVASSSVSAALLAQVPASLHRDWVAHIAGVTLLVIRVLSPTGSQAVLQSSSIVADHRYMTQSLSYLNVSHWDGITGWLLGRATVTGPRTCGETSRSLFLIDWRLTPSDPGGWRQVKVARTEDCSSLNRGISTCAVANGNWVASVGYQIVLSASTIDFDDAVNYSSTKGPVFVSLTNETRTNLTARAENSTLGTPVQRFRCEQG